MKNGVFLNGLVRLFKICLNNLKVILVSVQNITCKCRIEGKKKHVLLEIDFEIILDTCDMYGKPIWLPSNVMEMAV